MRSEAAAHAGRACRGEELLCDLTAGVLSKTTPASAVECEESTRSDADAQAGDAFCTAAFELSAALPWLRWGLSSPPKLTTFTA